MEIFILFFKSFYIKLLYIILLYNYKIFLPSLHSCILGHYLSSILTPAMLLKHSVGLQHTEIGVPSCSPTPAK